MSARWIVMSSRVRYRQKYKSDKPCNLKELIMSHSACTISSDQPNGILKFLDSSDFMKARGTVSRLLLARETPGLRCSLRTRTKNQRHQVIAVSECFTSLSARIGKIFSPRSAN